MVAFLMYRCANEQPISRLANHCCPVKINKMSNFHYLEPFPGKNRSILKMSLLLGRIKINIKLTCNF